MGREILLLTAYFEHSVGFRSDTTAILCRTCVFSREMGGVPSFWVRISTFRQVFFAACGGKWVRSWKKPAICQTCGRIFPRPNSRNVSPVTSRRSRNTPPAMSRRSSVVSWSDSPRDQAVPKSEDAVMEDCTESHQTWNEMLGEQSRSHVGTALPAAMGPCAPSEPVPHSSGFVVYK